MGERGIENWVNKFCREEMPLFNRTVEHVAGMANQENGSLSELAWSVLEDPALTSRVLKLANSIHYNPSPKRIKTVSRAVMRLGTNMIKEICLAISLIESVLSGLHKERVAVEVARSFHAAVQAREIACRLNLADPEEVFIAALLARIGYIAFWCFAGEMGPQLEKAIQETGNEAHAELEVLGFRLERLTERLSEEWKLSDLLDRSFRDRHGNDARIKSIKLGCAVACASRKGWDSPEIQKTIKEVSNTLHLPEKETTELLHESAREAAEVTESYGTKSISRLVPIPSAAGSEKPVRVIEGKNPAELSISGETKLNGGYDGLSAAPPTRGEKEYPAPDLSIQLGSLRDLSALTASKNAELNMVLSIVLEGIYRGIGMDRVFFGLITPDRRNLKGKYGLGCIEISRVENFVVSLGADPPNILGWVLKNKKPLWVTEPPDPSIQPLLTAELVTATGGGPCFIMPISIKEVAIGVIYADRKPSGRKLDDESFENFVFFGQQANMSLNALAD